MMAITLPLYSLRVLCLMHGEWQRWMGRCKADTTKADAIVTSPDGADGTPRLLGICNFRDRLAWEAWGVVLTMKMRTTEEI